MRNSSGATPTLLRKTFQKASSVLKPQKSATAETGMSVPESSSIARAIRTKKYKMICINEDENENLDALENIQKKLVAAFDEILPGKSSFEK